MKRPKPSKAVTIYEISRRAGVSIATVSRAVNPQTRHKVAPETFRAITALVDKYGYTPNLAARHLGGSTFKTIGLVMGYFRGLFFSDYHTKVLAGVADALLDTDYVFKLIMVKPTPKKWDRYNFKIGEGVDGLIVTHWPTFFSKASVLEALDVPCVVINDPEHGVRAYFTGGDNVLGGKLAARYLYAKGHRRIVVVAGPSWSSDSALRLRGFKAFFRTCGGRVRLTVVPGEFDRGQARSAAHALLKTDRSITAFFSCNDDMALGVLEALRELHVRCPEDISVMGYDDDARAQTAEPSLTTIRVPLYDIAKTGANRLVRYLTGEDTAGFAGRQTLFPVELVERQSVRQRK